MADGAERPENTPNYVFHGPINTEAQGHPVPVLLGGPLRIGSAVISAGISADAFTADNDTIGSGFRVINKGSYTFGYRYPTAPGADISLPLLATDGVPAYTWSFLSNPGSIFSIVAGALTTLDLPAGGYTVVVMATDSTAAEAIKEITIYSIAEGSGGDGDDPT
jgi:hypothetical protein